MGSIEEDMDTAMLTGLNVRMLSVITGAQQRQQQQQQQRRPSVRFGTDKTGSNTCLSNSLFACMGTKEVFNRPRHNILSLLDTRTEGESLKDTMTELATFYKLVQIHGAQDSVVCDLSSNNLTFDHAVHISIWLRENSVKLYALDLSLNRIIQEQRAPVLELIRGLLESVELVNLGGNYLPPMLQDDGLQQIQDEGRVSLALPMYSPGFDAWQAGWNQLSEHFNQQAYGLVDESRVSSCTQLSILSDLYR